MFRSFWGVAPFVFCTCSESVFVVVSPACGHGRDPRVAAGPARGSTVRGPGAGAVPPYLTACIRGGELVEAGGEDGDLGFPGDGRLGAGGVREFRACLLGAPGVPLPSGDVQDVQRGAGGAVCCGGDRVQ